MSWGVVVLAGVSVLLLGAWLRARRRLAAVGRATEALRAPLCAARLALVEAAWAERAAVGAGGAVRGGAGASADALDVDRALAVAAHALDVDRALAVAAHALDVDRALAAAAIAFDALDGARRGRRRTVRAVPVLAHELVAQLPPAGVAYGGPHGAASAPAVWPAADAVHRGAQGAVWARAPWPTADAVGNGPPRWPRVWQTCPVQRGAGHAPWTPAEASTDLAHRGSRRASCVGRGRP